MHILVTRPTEDARALTQKLIRAGHRVTHAPLMTIKPLEVDLLELAENLAEVQALIFTSANGVRAFKDLTPDRSCPVYAVGDATGQIAREAGFTDIKTAGGDVESLAALIQATVDPKKGPLFHAAGKVVAGDLIGVLGKHGISVRRQMVYSADAADILPEQAVQALSSDLPDIALFYSPRTARIFMELVTKADLLSSLAQITAGALSPAVEAALRPASSPLHSEGWQRIVTAENPSEDALLTAFNLQTPHPNGRVQNVTSGPENSPPPSSDESPKTEVNPSSESKREPEVTHKPASEPATETPSSATDEPTFRKATGSSAPEDAGLPAKTRETTVSAGTVISMLAIGLLGGVAAFALIPRAVDAVPTLNKLFPNSNAVLVDQLSAELAAQDNAMTALKRRYESLSGRLTALNDETASQSTLLRELEARVAALDEGGTAKTNGSPAARLEMLTLRIGQLESAFVPLSQQATQAIESTRNHKDLLANQDQLTATLNTFDERLQGIEQSIAGDRRGTLISLSFAALREIANRGRSFAAEYEALTGLLAESKRPDLTSELQSIAAYAPSGAPALSTLRTNFNEAATAILHEAALPEDASWWRRAIVDFKTLITIRPTGEVAGTNTEAVLARAEHRLANNDLTGAISEIKSLPPRALSAAAPWLRGAEARLNLDEGLARFANVLIHAAAAGEDPVADADTDQGMPHTDTGASLPSGSGA